MSAMWWCGNDDVCAGELHASSAGRGGRRRRPSTILDRLFQWAWGQHRRRRNKERVRGVAGSVSGHLEGRKTLVVRQSSIQIVGSLSVHNNFFPQTVQLRRRDGIA